MREDFLHYVWRFKKLTSTTFKTVQGKEVRIKEFGSYLQKEGPDFFNAKLYIDGQLWAGTIEMHLKSSDWYAHRHEQDPAYNNVILHVVWEDDVPVYQINNEPLLTLLLPEYVEPQVYQNYLHQFSTQEILLCSAQLHETPSFILDAWKERLLIERLEEKALNIEQKALQTTNDWEAVFYQWLLQNFGLNTNGTPFAELAQLVPWYIVQKERGDLEALESLFFGTMGWLKAAEDSYTKKIQKKYTYLSHKYELKGEVTTPGQFFKLRPDNFPTLRLAQLAQLFHQHDHLFQQLIVEPLTVEKLHAVFAIEVSPYWQTHYVFHKESPFKKKKISAAFLELLLINALLPLQFQYKKSRGDQSFENVLLVYEQLKPEANAVVQLFERHHLNIQSAYDSQAYKQLKTHYCDFKKCTSCAIGHYLLNKTV